MKTRLEKPARILFAVALISAVIVTAAGPVTAAGTTHYVDPAGSNDAPGTKAAPWETLQHAVDNVAAGDTIVVNPGTYAGMRIEHSGEPGALITLTAAVRGTVVIDRPGPSNVHDSNLEIETWDGDGTVHHWVVKNIEVRGAPNAGIDVRGTASNHSHHITIRNVKVHHNGVATTKTGIFFAFVDYATVTGANSHHNGEHGIYLSNSGDHFTIQRNRLHHNERCGLHINGDLSQGGDGVISAGQIDANRIEANGAEGCSGINLDGVTDTTISNNVIVENHATGIAVFQQDGAVCSRQITIANNTIVQAADGRWAVTVGTGGCRDLTILNNVLLTRHPWRGAIELPDLSVPGLHSDYNLVADRFSTDDGDTTISIAQWRKATGQDTHSRVAGINAVFATGSYRHLADGPAEDAGTTVALAHDHDDVARPTGAANDIGAYETPMCRGHKASIVGTRAGDTLVGSWRPDVIAGLGGHDEIRGFGGDDLICGGDGDDHVAGNKGADHLRGNGGTDTIRGGDQADAIYGGKGPDALWGGDGADGLWGEGGNDALHGGPGTDALDGGFGDDQCFTGESLTACEL